MGLTLPADRELAGAVPLRKGSRLPATTTPETTEAGLSPDVRSLVASSIAPNTRKAYEVALAAWDTWLDGREASDELLAKVHPRVGGAALKGTIDPQEAAEMAGACM